jgi:hypothetical protein
MPSGAGHSAPPADPLATALADPLADPLATTLADPLAAPLAIALAGALAAGSALLAAASEVEAASVPVGEGAGEGALEHATIGTMASATRRQASTRRGSTPRG